MATKSKTETRRIEKIRDNFGKDAFQKWGHRGGQISGGSPVYKDKEVMKLYYKRHPKQK